MRERTTWNRDLIKQAAMKRQADPYTMNQDHPQPAADAYVIGGPSEFAEDVNKDNRWEDEYAGGQVKRDEIGMPELRTETFNHPEKTAAMDEATLLKKANICVKTAKLMLPKTAKEAAIEDQAVALMNLPDYDLFETFTRLASDEDQDEDQGEDQDKQAAKTAEESEDQGEEQDKQAGQMPPQFKENAEKKKEEAEAKKDEDKDDEGQKQAAQQFSQQDVQAMVAQAIQQQQAQQQQEAQAQQQEAQDQQQVAQDQAPVAQQDIQALIAQQVQQQLAQMQQQGCGQMAQQEPEVQADEEILFDDAPADEMGIQMDAPIMDTGDVVLGPEDDVLQSLFANDESQAQQDIQDQDQGQKQANVRTASTRTVGTKPSAGVSRIGGTSAAPATNELDRLSGLWQSAPDVRDAFGLPNK